MTFLLTSFFDSTYLPYKAYQELQRPGLLTRSKVLTTLAKGLNKYPPVPIKEFPAALGFKSHSGLTF